MTAYEDNTFPPSWHVGHLHLVPADPYVDPNLDTPERIAARRGVTPAVKRAVEDFMVLPVIHVQVRTGDRAETIKDLLAHLTLDVGGAHVPGFVTYSIGPNVEVV